MLKHRSLLASVLFIFAAIFTARSVQAQFVHPGVMFNLGDLDRMKTNRAVDPWKTGYMQFTNRSTASINYAMQGPFAEVGSKPDLNVGAHSSDMGAVFDQALMWYLTGNTNYAEKAISIINAWANTHRIWSGDTWSGLQLGPNALSLAMGAEILRYTYPGWDVADTTNCNGYLLNMYWNPDPNSKYWTWGDTNWETLDIGVSLDDLYMGAGNQGLYRLRALMAVAIELDDTNKLNTAIGIFRSANCVSLARNTLSTGQCAEAGRDQAHSMMEIMAMAWMAELAGKQSIDLYSDLSNRVLTAHEYWCQYNLGNSVPYSSFGPCWSGPWSVISTQDRATKFPTDSLEMVYAEYVLRRSLAAPWTLKYRGVNPINSDNFLYNQDTIPTIPLPPAQVDISSGSGEVVLSWSPGIGASTYNVKRGTASSGPFTTLATGLASPNRVYVNSGLVNGTTYYYVVSSVSGGVEGTNSIPVSAKPAALAFANVDVNNASPAGSGTVSGNTWTLTGSGGDIGSGGDTFHFTYRTMRGDGAISARLASGTGGKIGLMMRNNTNALSGSALIVVDFTASGGAAVRTASRTEGDGNMYWGGQSTGNAPKWLRLRRVGKIFYFAYSSDGASWVDFGSAVPEGMADTLVVGMGVCGRGSLKTGVFDNVTVPPVAPPLNLSALGSTSQISLSWNPAAGATSYNVKRSTTQGGPYTNIISGVTSNSFADTTAALGTLYYYVVSSVEAAGESANSTEASAAIFGPPTANWLSLDVGNVGVLGSFGLTNGVFTIQGSGADIWNASDEFRYVFQPINGNISITARVTNMQNTAAWAKAGVMIRETLNGNSSFLINYLSPGNGVALQQRTNTGVNATGVANVTGITAPYWVRLIRVETNFFGYRSADGVNWTSLGATSISMNSNAYVGLIVCSLNDSVLNTSTFDNVSLAIPALPTVPTGVNAVGGNAVVGLNWTASSDVTGYRLKRATTSGGPYTVIASNLTSTAYFDTNVVNGTTYSYVVSSTNALAESANSLEVSGTPGTLALSSPWAQADVGSTSPAGSGGNSGGTFFVQGSGADIWGTADAFHYLYIRLTNDCSMTVRVVDMQNPSTYSKAGIMIRDQLTANAVHAMVDITPGVGVEFIRRVTTGGSTTAAGTAGIVTPQWLRLVRSGSNFTAYRSADGVTWTIIGTTLSIPAMSSGAYVGLIVNSHSAGNLCLAQFENVSWMPAPVSTAPIAFNYTADSDQLHFSWPADHTGWRLQVQTNSLANGLGTNWTDIIGSDATNILSVPIGSEGNVFFRLVSPN